MVYYPIPAHKQKMFAAFGLEDQDLPITNELTTKVISLPIHTEMEEEQLEYICAQIKTFLTTKMKRIAVIGTGYVGLVTGTCFAETGNQVICVDINEEKVNQLRNGVIPIYEPHLDVLFERNIKSNRLTFTTNIEEGIKDAEIIFLALPTPPWRRWFC